ncbi:MAG: exo-alpha-sialidase [Gemmatimonadaceae bacterium]|nr:exo-alpha-sialidase [Gemmatimonadaceae bacterium]
MRRFSFVLLALLGCGDVPSTVRSTELPSPTTDGARVPQLARGTDGRVWLSWMARGADSLPALFVAVRDTSGAWSAPRRVVRDSLLLLNWADFPSALPLDDGTLVVHFLQRSGVGAYDSYLVRSTDDGANWSPPVRLHRDDPAVGEHGFVTMRAIGRDQAMLVWLDGREAADTDHDAHGGTRFSLRSTTFSSAGTFGAEEVIDADVCTCCQTDIATTGAGLAAVYRGHTSADIRDTHVARFDGTAWRTAGTVHDDGWRIAACPVNGPAIDARGDSLAVVWFTAARDTARSLVAFSADGGASFGAPIPVTDGPTLGRLDLLAIDGAHALVTWIEERGAKRAVLRARTIARDETRGEAIDIAEVTGRRPDGFPRMVRDGDGVLLAWTDTRGATPRVRVARLTTGRGS